MWSTRNIRPSFNTRLGWYGGILYTGGVWYLTRGKEPWTFSMHEKGELQKLSLGGEE